MEGKRQRDGIFEDRRRRRMCERHAGLRVGSGQVALGLLLVKLELVVLLDTQQRRHALLAGIAAPAGLADLDLQLRVLVQHYGAGVVLVTELVPMSYDVVILSRLIGQRHAHGAQAGGAIVAGRFQKVIIHRNNQVPWQLETYDRHASLMGGVI